MDEIYLEWTRVVESIMSDQLKPYAQEVRICQDDGLGATWMGVLDLRLPLTHLSGRRRRCVVDTSLMADISTMSCDWQTFVYVALGFSVAPRSLEVFRRILTSSYDVLKEVPLQSESGDVVMQVSLIDTVPVVKLQSNESQVVRFSVIRALAWELIMILPNSKGALEIVPLVPDPHVPSGRTEVPSAFLAPVHSSDLQRDIANAKKPFEACLIWTIYFEQIRHSPTQNQGEALPVPQYLLILQQDAARELKGLPNLESRLKDIFSSKLNIVRKLLDKLQLSENKEAELSSSNRTGKPKVFQPGDLYMDIWPELQQNELFKDLLARYNPSPELRTKEPLVLSDLTSSSAILARVVMITSATQNGEQEEWNTKLDRLGNTVWIPNKNPLGTILEKGQSPPAQRIDFA